MYMSKEPCPSLYLDRRVLATQDAIEQLIHATLPRFNVTLPRPDQLLQPVFLHPPACKRVGSPHLSLRNAHACVQGVELSGEGLLTPHRATRTGSVLQA